MKVVIAAGGKGTRISSVNSSVPKPMIRVCGKPILEHQLECLTMQGFHDFILTVGHLGDQIKDYFGDGSRYNSSIEYYTEQEALGTAGALIALKDRLTEDFFLINGDLIFHADLFKMIRFHREKKAIATLFTHPNSHPYDGAVIETDEDCRVVNWLNKEEKRTIYENRVNAGIHILTSALLEKFSEVRKTDLDREILKPQIPSGRVFSWSTPEYIRDMGTPERYMQVCEDVSVGLPEKRDLRNLQKAVFLDRDGTLNVYKGFIRKWKDIELCPGAAEAVAQINRMGYLAVVVTNQPVIARGDCTWEELRDIHRALQTKLGEHGAYLDDIFICPHHPDRGFPNECVEYKCECSCRKPKPGMLLAAAERYNIDLSASYMIGDSDSDLAAGVAAGCTSIKIGVGQKHKTLFDAVQTLSAY